MKFELKLPPVDERFELRYNDPQEGQRAMETRDFSKALKRGMPGWEHARYKICAVPSNVLRMPNDSLPQPE